MTVHVKLCMENINILASHYGGNGLTQREAVSKANKLMQIILPNPLADVRIVRTDAWKKEKNAYPIWVSPLVAYRHDRNVFGPAIEYTDPWTGEVYYLDIPVRFTIIGLHSVIVQTHSTSDKAFASL